MNHAECFAEGVQNWFDDNRDSDAEHNRINTRAELLDYDPSTSVVFRWPVRLDQARGVIFKVQIVRQTGRGQKE